VCAKIKTVDPFKEKLISFIRNSDETFREIQLEKLSVSQLVIIKTHIEIRNSESRYSESKPVIPASSQLKS
jgi:hypothetical protein